MSTEPKPKTLKMGGRVFRCVPREYGNGPRDGANTFKYQVCENSISLGFIRAHDGPGPKGGNVRYYEWLNEDGSVENFSKSLSETVAENCLTAEQRRIGR